MYVYINVCVYSIYKASVSPGSVQLIRVRESESQSQSYFTTGGLPQISLSWRQAP
jgi:hypothetical protein